jgi:hypothetical protein
LLSLTAINIYNRADLELLLLNELIVQKIKPSYLIWLTGFYPGFTINNILGCWKYPSGSGRLSKSIDLGIAIMNGGSMIVPTYFHNGYFLICLFRTMAYPLLNDLTVVHGPEIRSVGLLK